MQEYVTDVTYVRGFDRELAPARLRLAAALNGFPTPPPDDFVYCELGPAYGDTLIALAASNPKARFFGIELNAEHVLAGNTLAREASVPNVELLERDFSALDPGELPDLDFLVMHGVLSWVGPEKRRAILDFAAKKLKPGGLLYVSYNAMPGWAALEPLRQLLVSGGGDAADSLERARKGLAFAKQMNEAGAEYFADNPAARVMLDTMEKAGLSYIAHEYLNAHWAPMYFAQVAWEMSTSDLHFAGQLPLYLNYRDIAIPPSLGTLFGRVADRPTFESLKDFALNEFFRRDVYVKGPATRTAALTSSFFAETPFSLTEMGIPAERTVALPHHTLKFEGRLFDAVFAALAEYGPETSHELAARPELAAFGEAQVEGALVRMLLGDHVAPALRTTSQVPAYNDGLLGRALTNAGPLVLASPVLGTGLPTTALGVLGLALFAVPPDDRDAWLTARLRGLKLTIRGKVIEEPAALRELVLGELTTLEKGLGVRLRALRAVAPPRPSIL